MASSSYIQVLNIFEDFAREHLEVKRYHSDFLEQLDQFGTDDERYPILYVVPQFNTLGNNIGVSLGSYTFNIYCVDILQKSRDNVNTILNTTNLILSDLHLLLRDGDFDIDILQVSNITPVNNYMTDYTAGWYINITLQVNGNSLCDIPLENQIGPGRNDNFVFIKGVFPPGVDTLNLTIDPDSYGTFTSISDDGSSGTITVSKNGSTYSSFNSPLTLSSSDTWDVKRTITGATGWYKIKGTY
jgi:hypothetical protein